MSVITAQARKFGSTQTQDLPLAEECAVAMSYDGTTQAVLMASPADLEDFGYGFSLTEGIAAPGEIAEIAAERVADGIDLRIWLHADAGQRFLHRRRTMVGPVGCGLCGVDTLAEAMRDLPVATGECVISASELDAAVAGMDAGQALRDATGATHAAGFFVPGRGLIALREDVGRHNALDKLAGALIRQHPAGLAGQGAVVITSRVSVDLVQKTAMLGAPVLIALAAPSSAAVAAARAAGIGLAARARSAARAEIYAAPDRFR
ncbi:FdhD protein [Paracoccus isoporae]|uniref:Sulfur carrier protein FdhD n=1 Tax=Paracoccus isoporae TaxID=591205 RepID=A0A1G6XPK1_9RHOB|nr:formate dehydrogenase accessory sulfurtransferase FdhD [Paracoccus isoporae]SDD79683.1 FdhD protein [Paracoccus isoporae]